MRAYSVCPQCCSVHITGAACPGCSDAPPPAAPPPIAPLRVTLGAAPLLGVLLGLAFVGLLLLGLGQLSF